MSICIQVPTDYGPMLVARHDINQTQPLITTGRAIDHENIDMLVKIAQAIGPDCVFLDVGANLGTYSLALAPHCREVHAFEAQRIIFQMLTGSAALSGYQHIHTYNYAVNDGTRRELRIPKVDYTKQGQYGGISFAGVTKQRPELPGDETVGTVSLDRWCGLQADLIKIDVEGMERAVLEGAKLLIASSRPVMLVEHLAMDQDPENPLPPFIEAQGYVVHNLGMDLLCIPKELKDTFVLQKPKDGK